MIRPILCLFVTLQLLTAGLAVAQISQQGRTSQIDAVRQQVERLAEAVAHDELELKSSRQEIQTLRGQVAELQGRMAGTEKGSDATSQQQVGEEAALRLNAEVETLREQQDLQQGEITTQEQAKVESASKFPVKLTGLLLMNGFVNSYGVNVVQSPTVATTGWERPDSR